MGLVSAAALGVGGMMGAGLYTLLGLAATSTGVLLPIAFALAGAAAAFSVYSYARLGATFPSRGGAAQFLLEGFGSTLVCGGLNVFQYLAYLIATALYAAGFAEYVRALVGDGFPSWGSKAVAAGIVIVFTVVNLVGSKLVGRAETTIVAIELVILVGLVVVGLFHADPSRLTTEGTPGVVGVVTGAALLYVTYQGFGVVTNAAGEMTKPRAELPKAMFTALVVVAALYLAISTVVVTVLPMTLIEADAGHVLADVGQAIAGRLGFVVVAAAAILATASAVNATIFAASNVGYDVADNRQLSRALTRTVWRKVPVALVVSAVIVVALVSFFPLAAVGQMTSLAFLVVYGAVSAGHLRVRHKTGAHAWPLVVAIVLNAGLFLALIADTIQGGETATWVTLIAALIGSFAFEALYRAREKRDPAQAAPTDHP
jgi:amino acid transporter